MIFYFESCVVFDKMRGVRLFIKIALLLKLNNEPLGVQHPLLDPMKHRDNLIFLIRFYKINRCILSLYKVPRRPQFYSWSLVCFLIPDKVSCFKELHGNSLQILPALQFTLFLFLPSNDCGVNMNAFMKTKFNIYKLWYLLRDIFVFIFVSHFFRSTVRPKKKFYNNLDWTVPSFPTRGNEREAFWQTF